MGRKKERAEKEYSFFINALREFVREYDKNKGEGGQNYIATGSDLTDGFISKILKPKYERFASFDQQVFIAKAAHYEYIDFLIKGGARISAIDELKEKVADLEGKLESYKDVFGKMDIKSPLIRKDDPPEKKQEIIKKRAI